MTHEIRLENIKVGDRVWLGQFSYRSDRWLRLNLRTVIAVTAKKFRVDANPKSLYSKANGKDWINSRYAYYAIATPKECAEWDAEQEQKRIAAAAEAKAQAEIAAQREQLYLLFTGAIRVNVMDENGAWELLIHGLTEAEVRELAGKINVLRPA